jgi:hypothetical protein
MPLPDQVVKPDVVGMLRTADVFTTVLTPVVNGVEVPYDPLKDKVLHVAMRLLDIARSVKPSVYSNDLAKRASRRRGQMLFAPGKYIELLQPIKFSCPLEFHFN